jgi:hypothetical protein
MADKLVLRPTNLIYTDYVLKQMAKQGLRKSDIELIVKKGSCYRRAGRRWYFLQKKNLSRELARSGRHSKLVGITVLVSRQEEVVVTVYRIPKLTRILRKAKYASRTSGEEATTLPLAS